MRQTQRNNASIQDLEECLDILADVIARSGDVAELGYPLWRQLEKEIETLKEGDRIKAAVRERMANDSVQSGIKWRAITCATIGGQVQ